MNPSRCPKCGQVLQGSGGCLNCALLAEGSFERRPSRPYEADPLAEPRLLGAKARFTPQADERGHYLLLQGREPVQIPIGKLFVIGRDPRTSLQLAVGEVSRQHCEIDWQGNPPRPTVAEVRSQNGTFLNGRRLEPGSPQPLRDGDEIGLGLTLKITYRNMVERELKKELLGVGGEATIVSPLGAVPRADASPAASQRADSSAFARAPTRAETPPAAPAPSPVTPRAMEAMPDEVVLSPLRGDFERHQPRVVLEDLYKRKATGVLYIRKPAADVTVAVALGSVVLAEGRAVRVYFEDQSGQGAVERILALTRGTYHFETNAVPVPVVQAPDTEGSSTAPPGALEEGARTTHFGSVLPIPGAAAPSPEPEGARTVNFGSVIPIPGAAAQAGAPEGGQTVNFGSVIPIPRAAPKTARPAAARPPSGRVPAQSAPPAPAGAAPPAVPHEGERTIQFGSVFPLFIPPGQKPKGGGARPAPPSASKPKTPPTPPAKTAGPNEGAS
jgi:hypothetical protein